MKRTRFGATKAGAHIAKVLPTAVASLIVFLVVGVWHGASWKYVAFGLWNGGVIMLSILMKPLFDRAIKKLHINPQNFFWKLFQILRTFIIVCIGYVFDIAPSIRQAMWTFYMIVKKQNFDHMMGNVFITGLTAYDLFVLIFGCLSVVSISIVQEKSSICLRTRIDKQNVIVETSLIVFVLLAIVFLGVYGANYNPADFVYAQF